LAVLGAMTFWENFDKDTSLCHGWASGPVWFLSREVLGASLCITDKVVRIAPRMCGLSWARGVFPVMGQVVSVE
jgi:hypothetical protein